MKVPSIQLFNPEGFDAAPILRFSYEECICLKHQRGLLIVMEMNRRALYNSLRMNWVLDPALEVEAWQVEDYRSIPLDQLFERLEDRDIRLDKPSFVAFSEPFDNPEDLTHILLHDADIGRKLQDQVYLIVFELWRRLLPEKLSISILCDEIDYQIHLYDQGAVSSNEGIADTLANLQVVLDENTDEGADSKQVFKCINSGCANDLESFLHDFISEKIDAADYSYAAELVEGFGSYLLNVKWVDLLRARLVALSNPDEANKMVRKLTNSKNSTPDLEFNLEMLSFLVSVGDRETFEQVARQTMQLLKVEDDFQALLSFAADFYHRLDCEEIEESLLKILKQRETFDASKNFNVKDPHFTLFSNILNKR